MRLVALFLDLKGSFDLKIIDLYETDVDGIYVDENGNAYSTRRDIIYKMKKQKQTKGYEYIHVWEDGKQKCVLIQRLMGNAHLGLDLKSKLQMNHINKQRDCNILSNLEVVTNKQNARHRNGHEDYKDVE